MPYPVAHPKVIDTARQILALDPIFLDTETTGTGPEDVVIEVGIVDLSGNVLYDSLINPGISIPPQSSAVNEITDDMVVNSPAWKQAWVEIEPLLQGRVVGMYNAEFDLRLLKQSNLAAGLPWTLDIKKSFCVMNLYAAFYGEWNPRRNGFRYHKLENAGKACSIALPNSHHASDDAKLTAALFKYIANYAISA